MPFGDSAPRRPQRSTLRMGQHFRYPGRFARAAGRAGPSATRPGRIAPPVLARRGVGRQIPRPPRPTRYCATLAGLRVRPLAPRRVRFALVRIAAPARGDTVLVSVSTGPPGNAAPTACGSNPTSSDWAMCSCGRYGPRRRHLPACHTRRIDAREWTDTGSERCIQHPAPNVERLMSKLPDVPRRGRHVPAHFLSGIRQAPHFVRPVPTARRTPVGSPCRI